MSDEFYSYLDDLLSLQSDAANRHNHKGVLGAVREEFLRQILEKRIDNINIHTGEVISKSGELGQHDIIIRRLGTINTEHGGNVRLNATDCSAVIEVKSNAKGAEVTSFNKKSQLIKNDNGVVVCGMVCYKLSCSKKTILERFGFVYDKDILGFSKCDNATNIQYNDLDFFLCLDKSEETTKDGHSYNKNFFIKKSLGVYELFLTPPFSKYFLLEINRINQIQSNLGQ